MPPQRRPRIRERGQGDLDEERFTSKDLTRKQIIFYIFEDFFKGFYIFLSLFVDGTVVFYLYQDPFLYNLSHHVLVSGFPIYELYFILLAIFMDSFFIYYEIKYYIKFFGEEATKKRYEKKSEKEAGKNKEQLEKRNS